MTIWTSIDRTGLAVPDHGRGDPELQRGPAVVLHRCRQVLIAVLENMGLGDRLQRGRRYARTGPVIDMEVAAGLVSARVQGSRAQPQGVRLSVTAYDKAQWAKLERALAEKAWYAAQLLSGAMPDDLEDVFAAARLPLFPGTGKDLSMDCSCPDWGVPCKHIALFATCSPSPSIPIRSASWRGGDANASICWRTFAHYGLRQRSQALPERILGWHRSPIASVFFRTGGTDSGLSAQRTSAGRGVAAVAAARPSGPR